MKKGVRLMCMLLAALMLFGVLFYVIAALLA